MGSLRRSSLLALLVCLALPGAAAAQPNCDADLVPAAGNLEAVAEATRCLVNVERSSRGLAPLAAEPRLSQAAAGHSRDMVERSYFDHSSPEGDSVADRVRAAGYLDGARRWRVGENIAWGTGSYATPGSIVASWMDSAGHRANILTADYEEIGLGVATGNPRDRSAGATYTHVFGSSDGSPAPVVTAGGEPTAPSNTAQEGISQHSDARGCRRIARKARTARSAQTRAKYRRAARRCHKRLIRRS